MAIARIGAGVIGLMALCGVALGQAPTATPDAAKPSDPQPTGQKPGATKPDDDAMRGPSVKEAARVASLVKRDMSGTLERLDTRPEQAAVGLLGLSAEERKATDALFADRFAAVTKLLQEQYDLFIKLQNARQGGASRAEIRPLMRDFHNAALPMLERPFVEQVEAKLPEGKRAEFRRLVDEYKRAMAAEEPGGMGAGNGTGGGGGRGRGVEGGGSPADKGAADGPIPPRVETNLLIRETARALNAMVTERKEHLASLLKAVEATPEQEGQIEAIVREQAEKNKPGTGGAGVKERTPEERLAVWEKILTVLTPEQRVKAREFRRK